MSGNTIFPTMVTDAHRHMDYWRPLILPCARNATGTSSNHLHSGTSRDSCILLKCFKCKCEGHCVSKCTYALKEGGLPVNSQEKIQYGFDALSTSN